MLALAFLLLARIALDAFLRCTMTDLKLQYQNGVKAGDHAQFIAYSQKRRPPASAISSSGCLVGSASSPTS